jgi:hypothetical protein
VFFLSEGVRGVERAAADMSIQRLQSFGLNRRYGTIAVILLVIIWLWVALDRPYNLPSHIYWNIYSNGLLSSQPTDAFDYLPVESKAIRSVCDETVWNDGLVFTCDESIGGIGSVRNSILNCVRYTIAAGAAMVLPNIDLRDPKDISHIRTGEKRNMAYMFDVVHFVDSMSLSCPGLRIFQTMMQVDDYKFDHKPLPLSPESLADNIPKTGLVAPETWRATFDKWLEQYSTRTGIEPVIVSLSRSFVQYPIYSDGADFALEFGTILKFRSDIRVLATNTLIAMSKAFNIPMDLNLPIIPNAFFGCHLQTEKDPTEVGPRMAPRSDFSTYETQLSKYLEQVPRSNPAFIYLASGDAKEAARFTTDAAGLYLNVTTKHSLLSKSGEDLEILNKLTWDQQAMVDFLVLLKASDFAGVAKSTFAWNVALRRHVQSRVGDYLDAGEGLSDEFSKIYGVSRMDPEFAACLWP